MRAVVIAIGIFMAAPCRADEATTYVHLANPESKLEVQYESGWQPLCSAPCNQWIPSTYSLRVDVDGVTEPLRLKEHPNQTTNVWATRQGTPGPAIALIAGGILGGVVGGIVLAVGTGATCSSNLSACSGGYDEGFLLAGAITLTLSVVALVAGLALGSRAHVTLRIERVAH